MKLRQIIIIENDQHLDYTGINPNIQAKLEKYKPHFQQWGIAEIRKGEHPESIIDAIEYYQNKIKDNRFQDILGKLTPAPKNILTLSLDQLKTAQSQYDEKYNRTSKRELRKQLKQDYVEVLLNTPQWKIIKIEKTDETDGAAKILAEYARGTKWCVTDQETGDDYLNRDSLYIIFKNGIKYALCHISSQQLMNIRNEEIELETDIYHTLSPYIPGIGIFTDRNTDSYREAIKETPELAYEYALDVIEGRWPEAEPYIMKDPKYAYYYAIAIFNGKRWPEAEPIIMKALNYAYLYALEVIEGRWPEAEPIIMKDPHYAYEYARTIIEDRWPKAEPYIMQHPEFAYRYARYVIEGRWLEAEPIIMKDPKVALDYVKYVLENIEEY